MKLQTYVNFAGRCAEAFRFYEKHLGGTIGMMMTHGQLPDQSQIKPEWKELPLLLRAYTSDDGQLDSKLIKDGDAETIIENFFANPEIAYYPLTRRRIGLLLPRIERVEHDRYANETRNV